MLAEQKKVLEQVTSSSTGRARGRNVAPAR
jgi:hypothetical protein